MPVPMRSSPSSRRTRPPPKKILKDAENEEVAEQRKLQTLKEKMFKASQELFDLRQIEASTIAEISGSQSQVKNLRHKIRALDKESVKQAELIYNAEYEIQLMERKLSVVKGERSDAEKKQLNAQIEKCKEELKEAKDQEKFLVNQTRKVNNEYTRSRRRVLVIHFPRLVHQKLLLVLGLL